MQHNAKDHLNLVRAQLLLSMSSIFSRIELDSQDIPYEGIRSDAVEVNTRWYPMPEDITIPPWCSKAIEVAIEPEDSTTPLRRNGRYYDGGRLRFSCSMTYDIPVVPNCIVNNGSPTLVTLGLWNASGMPQTVPKGALVLFAVPDTRVT